MNYFGHKKCPNDRVKQEYYFGCCVIALSFLVKFLEDETQRIILVYFDLIIIIAVRKLGSILKI
jgi:hypothetical protein